MFRKKFAIWWYDKDKIKETCWLLVMFLFALALTICIGNYNIRDFSGATQEKQGVLLDVWYSVGRNRTGLNILVDEQVYELYDWPYTNRTYGLKYSDNMEKLKEELEKRIGSAYSVNLKYLDRGKNERLVLHMSVNGEEFVNETVARRDLVEEETRCRNGVIIFSILTLLAFVVLMKRLRALKNPESV